MIAWLATPALLRSEPRAATRKSVVLVASGTYHRKQFFEVGLYRAFEGAEIDYLFERGSERFLWDAFANANGFTSNRHIVEIIAKDHDLKDLAIEKLTANENLAEQVIAELFTVAAARYNHRQAIRSALRVIDRFGSPDLLRLKHQLVPLLLLPSENVARIVQIVSRDAWASTRFMSIIRTQVKRGRWEGDSAEILPTFLIDLEKRLRESRIYYDVRQHRGFATWLHNVFHNNVSTEQRNTLRTRRSKAARKLRYVPELNHVSDRWLEAAEVHAEQRDEAEYLMRHTSEEERTVIYLRFYEGLKLKEIADRLGLKFSQVRGLLEKVLNRLARVGQRARRFHELRQVADT